MVVRRGLIQKLYEQYLEPLDPSASVMSILSRLQQAHWFYVDHIHDPQHDGPAASFGQFLHQFVPLLGWQHSAVKVHLKAFWKMNAEVPRAGGILLNPNQTKLVLVQAPGAKRWSFPVGKVGLQESEPACAQREVFEETGFQGHIAHDSPRFEFRQRKARYTLFVFDNVPEDYVFAPMSAQEIGCVRWFSLDELRTVLPRKLAQDVVNFLRAYVDPGRPLCTTDSSGSSSDSTPVLGPVVVPCPSLTRSLELLSLEPFAPLAPLETATALSASSLLSCVRI